MKIVYEGFAEYEGKRYPIHVEPGTLNFFLEPLTPGQKRMVLNTPDELRISVGRYVQNAQELLDKRHRRNNPEQPAPVLQGWMLSSRFQKYVYKPVTIRGQDVRAKNKALITHGYGGKDSAYVHDLYLGSEDDMKHWVALMAASQSAYDVFVTARDSWSHVRLSEKHRAEIDAAHEATVLTYDETEWVATFPGCDGLRLLETISAKGVLNRVTSEVLKGHYPWTLNKDGYAVESLYQVSPSYLFPDEKTAQDVAELYALTATAKKALSDWYTEHAYAFDS